MLSHCFLLHRSDNVYRKLKPLILPATRWVECAINLFCNYKHVIPLGS